jgi:hypothetical protein
MAPPRSGMSDTSRFLLAAGASLVFSLACLGAALHPPAFPCERAIAPPDYLTRL